MSNPHLQNGDEFGLCQGELRLVLVGPEWKVRFAAERCRIAEALGQEALDI